MVPTKDELSMNPFHPNLPRLKTCLNIFTGPELVGEDKDAKSGGRQVGESKVVVDLGSFCAVCVKNHRTCVTYI